MNAVDATANAVDNLTNNKKIKTTIVTINKSSFLDILFSISYGS